MVSFPWYKVNKPRQKKPNALQLYLNRITQALTTTFSAEMKFPLEFIDVSHYDTVHMVQLIQ